MAAGLPDLVDCMHLAEEAAVLEREYALGELPRLKDGLAEPAGVLHANFVFGKAASGRPAVTVSVRAAPRLVCQRCLKSVEVPVRSTSEVEFAVSEREAADAQVEVFVAAGGLASLRELAEEELLLALPLVAMCTTPCGNAPISEPSGAAGKDESHRPFADLRDLLNRQ